ncbi:MAG: glycosyltransferase family 4 protein [Gammaproteobacteria bacterium AqS3]|nr:glycosyltransferase family 4 protein [Gammaproteobacteria bacterium AqS3]
MRVLIALQRYFPHGGAQRDALALGEALVRRGHEVEVLCTRWDGPPAPAGMTARVVPVQVRSNHARAAEFSRAVSRVSGDFDCCVGFSRCAGLDVYFCSDDALAVRLQGRWRSVLGRYRTLLSLERAALGARCVLFLTEPQRDQYLRHYAPESHRILPPLLDPAAASAGAGSAPEPGDRRGVVAIVTDVRNKGLDRTVEIYSRLDAALHRRFPLTVVAAKCPRSLLRKMRRLGAECLPVQRSLRALYLGAAVLLHPARREAGGKVLLEAAACGAPVLASAVCGYAPLLEAAGAAKILPEPFDAGSAADALTALLVDEDQRRDMSQAGRRWGGAQQSGAHLEVAIDVVEQAA